MFSTAMRRSLLDIELILISFSAFDFYRGGKKSHCARLCEYGGCGTIKMLSALIIQYIQQCGGALATCHLGFSEIKTFINMLIDRLSGYKCLMINTSNINKRNYHCLYHWPTLLRFLWRDVESDFRCADGSFVSVLYPCTYISSPVIFQLTIFSLRIISPHTLRRSSYRNSLSP